MKKLIAFVFCASVAACSPVPAAELMITYDSLPDLKSQQMEMIRHGYAKEDNDYARILLNLKDSFPSNRQAPECIAIDNDLQLFPKFSDVKLAYKYTLPDAIKPASIIGASPLGLFVDERHGWSGFKVFFKTNDLTTCSFGYIDISLSGGNIALKPEDENFSINHKKGYKLTTGSKASGFVYSANWYDKTHVSMLDCATLKFERRGLENAEILANIIEGQGIQKSAG